MRLERSNVMKKEKGLILFDNLAFLTTILSATIYCIQNKLSVNRVFSVFWTYCSINHILDSTKSKRKYNVIMAILSFSNAILLLVLDCKSKKN